MPLPLNGCIAEGCWRLGASSLGTTDGIVLGKIAEVLPFGPNSLVGSGPGAAVVSLGPATAGPTSADIFQGKLAGNITPY